LAKKHFLLSRNQKIGLLFISPWIIGFAVFRLYPILSAIYWSFCKYNGMTSPKWIFLNNYIALSKDSYFWLSLYNTLYYTVFSVTGAILVAFVIALFLNMNIRGMAGYRTLFYIPSIVPIVAICILWIWILSPQYGLVSNFLGMIGIRGPSWLSDPKWSKPALIGMRWWMVGQTIVIYLAGLKDVPQQFYEAARIDGANWWNRTVHITFPMMTPVIFFTLIMNTIYALQVFSVVYIMTEGGPMNSTLVYALYLYR